MDIRPAALQDADALTELTAQLGYAADVGAIRQRITTIAARDDHLLVVAVLDNKIAGWLQAQASITLESGFRVEILGLVAAAGWRRRGVGRGLVEHAEQWARAQGAPALVARSNTLRTESHHFYPALGFAAAKTQAVYRKKL